MDCHAYTRNDDFNYIYALKNNFAIINLVKTFLTSIKFNFDSLSRKIKNPCLVIKKFYSKGVCKMKHTKNILKSLLIMVMALLLLAVSCKKDEGGSKPTDPTPITLGMDELNDIVMKFVKSQTSWKVDADASTAFKPTSGNGSISVTVNKAFADI